MNKTWFFVLAVMFFIPNHSEAGEEKKFTLTTYYPAPYGDYKVLKASESIAVTGPSGATATNPVLKASGYSGTGWVVTNANKVGIGIANPQARLDVDGEIMSSGTITAAGFFHNSDLRCKSEIMPITDAIAIVKNLEGVRFTFKKDHRRNIGLIAQNVSKVVPEVVETGSDGMQRVAYSNLIAVLIEAVKEQEAAITRLEEQVLKQQRDMELLKQKWGQMK